MVIPGRIENGVVILPEDVILPEGAEVSVVVRGVAGAAPMRMTEEQLRRYRESLAAIEALPNENPGDTFRGADHDKVLYGDGS